MKLRHKISLGAGVLSSRLLGRRTPLVVGWALTNRCNLRCAYCTIPQIEEKELTTSQVHDIIDQLAAAGGRRIGFTGGEPFVRADLHAIVCHSKKRGFFTGVTSNGILVAQHLDVVRELDLLMLSLDGPEEIQDRYRGAGSHAAVVELLERLPSEKLALSCVLYAQNLDHVDYTLELARRFSVRAHVQPMADITPLSDDVQPTATDVETLVPDKAAYQRAIDHLIDVHDRYPLLNSVRGLRYLRDHPHQEPVQCPAGRVFFRISASGMLSSCARQLNDAGVSILDEGVSGAIRSLASPVCKGCSTADGIELTHIYRLDPDALIHAFKVA